MSLERRTPLKRTGIKRGKRKPKRTEVELADYQAVRVYTIRRAGGRCEAAGLHAPGCTDVLRSDYEQHVHHIWPRERGGPDEIWNTMLVHPDCHLGRIHAAWGVDRGLGNMPKSFGFLADEPWEHGDRWRPWEVGG